MPPRTLLALALLLPLADAAPGQEPAYTRTEDVIYGRKYGTVLTMDVFAPKAKPNGRGVVFAVSGGWFSSHEVIAPNVATFVRPFTDRGYTVFAVVHGSVPAFTIPEVLDDMHRAVRFIKANAGKYGVDPERLGITGGSAGGHLSLMQGTAFKPGDPDATDPLGKLSSRVAAVGCFYPPTDFLNYGKDGETAIGHGTLAQFRGPFAFREYDPKVRGFNEITDDKRRREIARQISPAYHVSKDSAPALVIHGDADKLVPMQQAELIGKRYEAVGVPFKLVVKPGAGHGWGGLNKDAEQFADWFDTHLRK
ncbi:MAG: alpha/beta hydrolase [Gemmataceae bacterium]|nr:alpha/beta hydrolase [Gemmataceae bacterium]